MSSLIEEVGLTSLADLNRSSPFTYDFRPKPVIIWRNSSVMRPDGCPNLNNETRAHRLNLQMLDVGLTIPLCVLGLLLNAVALFCLHRPPKIKSGVLIYLNTVLVLDLAHLGATLLEISGQYCTTNKGHFLYQYCGFYRLYLIQIVYRLVMIIDTAFVWSISALAIHRYWKISRPVYAKLHDTKRSATLMMAALVVCSILFRLPSFFELRVVRSSLTGRLLRIETDRKWREDNSPVYHRIYHLVLNTLFYHLIPFLLMAFFSALTLINICGTSKKLFSKMSRASGSLVNGSVNDHHRRAALQRSHSSGKYAGCLALCDVSKKFKRETRATVSVLLIVCVFLAMHSLWLYSVTRAFQREYDHYCHTIFDIYVVKVQSLMSAISATMNAFIFIAVTNKVKKYLEVMRRRARSSGSSAERAPGGRGTMISATNSPDERRRTPMKTITSRHASTPAMASTSNGTTTPETPGEIRRSEAESLLVPPPQGHRGSFSWNLGKHRNSKFNKTRHLSVNSDEMF